MGDRRATSRTLAAAFGRWGTNDDDSDDGCAADTAKMNDHGSDSSSSVSSWSSSSSSASASSVVGGCGNSGGGRSSDDQGRRLRPHHQPSLPLAASMPVDDQSAASSSSTLLLPLHLRAPHHHHNNNNDHHWSGHKFKDRQRRRRRRRSTHPADDCDINNDNNNNDNDDEISLEQCLKRVRLSCSPGELRLQRDLRDLLLIHHDDSLIGGDQGRRNRNGTRRRGSSPTEDGPFSPESNNGKYGPDVPLVIPPREKRHRHRSVVVAATCSWTVSSCVGGGYEACVALPQQQNTTTRHTVVFLELHHGPPPDQLVLILKYSLSLTIRIDLKFPRMYPHNPPVVIHIAYSDEVGSGQAKGGTGTATVQRPCRGTRIRSIRFEMGLCRPVNDDDDDGKTLREIVEDSNPPMGDGGGVHDHRSWMLGTGGTYAAGTLGGVFVWPHWSPVSRLSHALDAIVQAILQSLHDDDLDDGGQPSPPPRPWLPLSTPHAGSGTVAKQPPDGTVSPIEADRATERHHRLPGDHQPLPPAPPTLLPAAGWLATPLPSSVPVNDDEDMDLSL